MIGWLIRCLTQNDIDLLKSLNELGKLHRNIGININHFEPMLNSMHESFSYYFPVKYGIEVLFYLFNLY